jgi:hypothetical protein
MAQDRSSDMAAEQIDRAEIELGTLAWWHRLFPILAALGLMLIILIDLAWLWPMVSLLSRYIVFILDGNIG